MATDLRTLTADEYDTRAERVASKAVQDIVDELQQRGYPDAKMHLEACRMRALALELAAAAELVIAFFQPPAGY